MKGRSRIHVVDGPAELKTCLSTSAIIWDVLVLAIEPTSSARLVGLVRTVASDWPELAIVACCKPGTQYSNEIRALAIAGVHQFVFLGIDDTGIAVRAVVSSARRLCAGEWVLRHLAEVVPVGLHPIVEVVLRRPAEILTVEALAAALGVHRRTLFNRCERGHFVAPAELITWVRLSLVAYLLAKTGMTVEAIALDLSFASDTALRNTIKRYTGLRASDIRGNGGLACVVRSLCDRIAAVHAV
jgi:AraC-like DNA-binding protein